MNMFFLKTSRKIFLKTSAIFCLSLFLLTTPFLVIAQTQTVGKSDGVTYPGNANYPARPGDQYPGLVPCDGPAGVARPDRTCSFETLLRGINGIINWLFIIAVPLSLVSFAYAGIMIMTGVEGNISTGKKVFSSVVHGVVIMAVAWLLVHTIIRGLLNPEGGFGSYLFGL